MFYQKARSWLDEVAKTGSILGLENIRNLMEELGNPQDHLSFVHIAGTNGKGSVLAFTSTILQEAGYKVGRYISPSVLGYLERYQINGEWMSEEDLGTYAEMVKNAVFRMTMKGMSAPTVFEVETAIAFLWFMRNGCDYVVLECGLGGRTDSTNIIRTAKVCAYASISMDHMGVLGNTQEEIARVKAGIIKPGAAVVTGWQKPSVEKILERTAGMYGCPVTVMRRDRLVRGERRIAEQEFSYDGMEHLKISLAGDYQPENAATAIEVIRALNRKGAKVSEAAIREGLSKTRWPGRFEILSEEPVVVLDGAHNEDAARRLSECLNLYFPDRPVYAVMGVFKDKAYEKIADILSGRITKAYTIDLPNAARTLPKEVLAEALKRRETEADPKNSIPDALDAVLSDVESSMGIALITGSLSYLGEARSYLLEGYLAEERGRVSERK